MTNQVFSLCVAILAMWMVIAGIAYMIGGPAAARAVIVRPSRWGFRIVRRAVGWFLLTLGRWIRG
jgi:hypothetical protein